MKINRSLHFIIGILLSFVQIACSQNVKTTKLVAKEDFDKRISSLLNFTVPVIGVEELANIKNEVIIFDAREYKEYKISHIENAEYIGYKKFDANQLKGIPKDQKIVLYCSIGYRSEKIGEQIKELGFTKVYNLYGSIFEWANRGYELVDINNKP
ncbi:MAG: rhodanese-like domain-containing protein, partial [Bacteroidota bacterium]